MHINNDLTQSRLKKLFRYDSGKLVNISKRKGGVNPGDKVGVLGKRGYLVCQVDGKIRYVHRLIYLYHHGFMPKCNIDHVNRNKTDNRIENLRACNQKLNSRNTWNYKHNKSGVKGVSWDKQRDRWKAHITINGKCILILRTDEFVEAVCARVAAEQCCGWPGKTPASEYLTDNKNLNETI